MIENQHTDRLLIAFYGDDFTGSTDALESLSRAGIKTMLFIDAPTPQKLAQYPDLQAIGIAGMSRSFSPEQMEKELPAIFKAIKELNPVHVHYKVCSTFDSSPEVGSIGRAIDLLVAEFKTSFVPLLVAAPILGRYCLFGNLFAQVGIGSEGEIFRLDRHPSMMNHPITPADESDLRLHLAKQTHKSIGLFSILDLQKYQEGRCEIDFSGKELVLFDALQQTDLTSIGEIIAKQNKTMNTVVSVGSSGVGMALGSYWTKTGMLNPKDSWSNVSSEGPILVVSGSCSNVTANQINYALKNGFEELALDTINFAVELNSNDFEACFTYIQKVASGYAQKASDLIRKGKSVILHTSLGHSDHRNIASTQIFRQKKLDQRLSANYYGTLLGLIAKEIVAETSVHRVVVAGGDTSSFAARAMGIQAVEMIRPFSPGAPICLAHAEGSSLNNIQVIFKGGQVGKEDFFVNASIS